MPTPLLRDPCYLFLVPVFQRMHPQNLELGSLENGHRWGTETSQLKYISNLELDVLQGPHPREGISALLGHPWHWSQPLCPHFHSSDWAPKGSGQPTGR